MAKVIVVGGGIAGLGAAYTLQKQGVDVSVLEAEAEVGGRMRSRNWNGAWIELGAEYLSSSELSLLDLISELGLNHRMHDYHWGEVAFDVWRNNRGHPVSFSRLTTLLSFGALGLGGRLRLARLLPAYIGQMRRSKSLAADAYEPRQMAWADDESIETWLSRINPQFLEYCIEPLFEYMYSFRPYEISKGWFLHLMTAHRNVSVHTFDEGLGLVTRKLAEELDVTTRATTTRVVAGRTPAVVEWEKEGRRHRSEVDAVLVAVPGTRVLGLVEGLDTVRVKFFESIRYSPQEIPYFTLSREVEGLPIMRFYPRKEDRRLNTIIYSPCPATPNVMLFRAKLKTDVILQSLDKSTEDEFGVIREEVSRYFPDAASAIQDGFLYRWREGLAVFYPGYARMLERFLQLPPIPGLTFAGDYLTSSNTGAAYRSGQRAATDLLNRLS